jgi:hypothetical protein
LRGVGRIVGRGSSKSDPLLSPFSHGRFMYVTAMTKMASRNLKQVGWNGGYLCGVTPTHN